jgi:2-methylcitrate dehydratase PrpD
MNSYSSAYADFILDTRYDQLKPEVILQAKKVILDTVGVSLAGYQLMEFPQMIIGYISGLGGIPEATIIHIKKRYPAINAAFANSSCAHALDMDDGHRFAALHPGTVIIPAALAATELSNASSKDLITGVVIGYDIMIRIGMAINPSSLNRGFHSTGITGPFGAAAAAASILKLTREEIMGAIGLAGLQGSGVLQVNHDPEGAKVKPINPAKAAMSGLLSTILAQKGAKGPERILEGEDGFFQAFTDKAETNLLTDGLGSEFEICNTYFKFYAACRHAHAAIDAAMEAFKNSHININEIKKIVIETYPAAIRLAGITKVTTPSSGRFSIPFSVALALIKGDAGANQFCDENVRDGAIQSLAGKVELLVGNKWEQLYPKKRGATVSIVDIEKKTWTKEVELAKGEPENPANWEDIYNKFYTNANLLISKNDAKALAEILMNLEDFTINEMVRYI